MALTATLLMLPGMLRNAFGIFILEYDIAIWSAHMLLCIVLALRQYSSLRPCLMLLLPNHRTRLYRARSGFLQCSATASIFFICTYPFIASN